MAYEIIFYKNIEIYFKMQIPTPCYRKSCGFFTRLHIINIYNNKKWVFFDAIFIIYR